MLMYKSLSSGRGDRRAPGPERSLLGAHREAGLPSAFHGPANIFHHIACRVNLLIVWGGKEQICAFSCPREFVSWLASLILYVEALGPPLQCGSPCAVVVHFTRW